MCMPVMFQTANCGENGKIRMKCVEKFDARAEDASSNFLDLLIVILITETSHETLIF